MLQNITSPYNALEAWAYDHLIAPAAQTLSAALEAELSPRIKAGAAVLEVGCGGGQLALNIVGRRPELTWTGIDLSPEQVARARRRTRSLAQVSFVEGDALRLPFTDASFDVVVSIASIKHWSDQAGGLRESVRVLRPGGSLIVVEADRGCRHEDATRFIDSWPIPHALRGPALAFFRTWIAGRSLDHEEARALLQLLPVAEYDVRRVPNTPVLEMTARK